ncbi:DALR anticodon-binding domain-containing protein 3 [Camelus dromedarius]|uniref:DALR anticodon-binding domain-containing protein 3 n=2 Tax=Camelus dromedarius TaxID=9838 RepID=A0A5N4D0E4_CAMDR|nr:DALR anticodon-binding domain-containing protein 3 isoform X1 [Camelus dromedarius]KAB1264583.1 DALR anticodon-binding domain-containing protein 3 [Camelus dromedarius]KAB1264584.1 DALR anticodon-binding domain-containing protein 3 [Camelus dromedarius]KAB1264587.1 DALR anticodon-binding domain-containing protein 3 [Camelus dromedarius]
MAMGRLGVEETLEALNAALGPGGPVWFKETRARHLRVRDFFAPRRALRARFGDGQVPERVVHAIACLQGPGVAPVLRCVPTPTGLALQLQRSAVFERVLGAVAAYAAPSAIAAPGRRVVLHCPALRGGPGALRLSQLRAVLVADHLARALRAHGVSVRQVPAVRDPHMSTFLQQLRVDWPVASERTANEALRSRAHAKLTSAGDSGALFPGALGSVRLKELVDECGHTASYDPNLDSCLVTEDLLSVLAELQEAVQHQLEEGSPGMAAAPDTGAEGYLVVHVVSCEEEFQQQKLDLLWRKLDDQAPLRQKHLVCGPVKVAGVPGTLTAPEYYELRHAQVCKASALKHGRDLAQDPAWTEIFMVLSVAAIKFEMLSTAPQSQLLLALTDNISTKGTKSGTFVMYNCARLATLFEGYECSMEQGLYPTFPPVSSLDFSQLHDEGEWLLLFNSVLPFPDLLSHTAALACTAPGLHITARTEMVCKFLVQLSMDFSSYYNRVHILGEPRPHLFGQMFARLQLLRAVREVLHTGLAMLGLPPLSHI